MTIRFVVRASLVSALLLASASVSAQRRARREPPAPPPVELSLEAPSSDVPQPYRRVLTIRATAPVELHADRRLLHLEVRTEGARRALRCDHPDAPRRMDRARVRRLQPGETWQEWIDLREYCWGRALDALRAGADLEITYGARRARRGDFTVRALGDTPLDHAMLGPISRRFDPIPAPADTSTAPVRVLLGDHDARSGGAVSFRVSVRSREGRIRAYVRPDRFRFHVRAPGVDVVCSLRPAGGSVPADLFQRLAERSGPRFSLDPRAFCPPGTFDAAGIYEITPSVALDQSGARWGFDAPTGVFTGAPATFRVRRDARGYVARDPEPVS